MDSENSLSRGILTWIKPSFVFFAQGWASECPDVKN